MPCRYLNSTFREEWPLHQCAIKNEDFPKHFLPIKEAFEKQFSNSVSPNDDCPFAYRGLEECEKCPLYNEWLYKTFEINNFGGMPLVRAAHPFLNK